MLNAEIKPKFYFLPFTKQINFIFFTQNSFLRKSGRGGLNKKWKEGFLTSLPTAIKKDPTRSRRKYANELNVNVKIVRTAIKEDFSPDLKPLDYAVCGVLKNKRNATSDLNIGSLTTPI